MKDAQIAKAEHFRALHQGPKLLVLPNIWDPLGARLLEHLRFPAVATASASVAFSLGYDDGEKITYAAMLDAIRRIAASVGVPVTADIERGYADDPDDVAENIRDLLRTGAVGINIEDGIREGGRLRPVESQCARIGAARRAADREGIPLFINARIDTFMREKSSPLEEKLAETIQRARAYVEAGADGIYPITVGDIDTLRAIRESVEVPINVYASASTAPMRDLQALGINRLSVGPGLLKAALTTMKKVALDLKDHGSYEALTHDVISSAEVQRYVSHDKMPDRLPP
jgi:2-methylisocitrate lyase-like PEP mutase family enzyme